MRKKQAIIVGAGYAGIIAANRLARKSPELEVLLVTANPLFSEKIRNHQVIAGTKTKSHSIRKMLHKKVGLKLANVQKILTDRNSILLGNGEELQYDYLGYTPGMRAEEKKKPNNESYFSIVNEEDCLRLRKQLLENSNVSVTVIGGGLSGLETATELAESYPGIKITILDSGNIGKSFHPDAIEYMKKVLSDMDVNLLEKSKAKSFEKESIVLENGSRVLHDYCVFAAGLVASDLGSKSELAHNGIGQIFVDQYLQVPESPNILGAGDAVKIDKEEYSYLRMSCATALPMGVYLAERMAHLAGYDSKLGTKPFNFGYLGRCVSLGRSVGLIQFVSSDDQAQDRMLKGKLGGLVKELVCKFTILSCHAEKYFNFYSWPKHKEKLPSADASKLAVLGK